MSSGPSTPNYPLAFQASPGSLPAEYVLAPSEGVAIESVRAHIDGTGASGAFYPCLSIYSQDGKLVARVPTSTAYAVGDTGEVTWSPFLRKTSASTPSGGTQPSVALLTATETVVGASRHVAWTSFETNDTTTFSTSATSGGAPHNVSGDVFLRVAGGGAIWVVGGAVWDIPTAGQQATIIVSSARVLDQYQLSEAQVISSIYGQGNWPAHSLFLNSGASPNYLSLDLNTGSGHDADVTMGAIYLPSADLASVF